MFEEKDKVTNSSNSDETSSNKTGGPIEKHDKSEPKNLYDDSETQKLNNSEIIMTNITAKWSDGQSHNSLENINLTIRPGQLVAIIGPVGAGKV